MRVGGRSALICAFWLHPLHTTITTISYDARTHVVTAMMRIFVDDLTRAVGQRSGRAAVGAGALAGGDSAATEYVRAMFTVAGNDGRSAPLAVCGVRRTGDVQWICLRATLPHGLAGVRIADAVLTELYADQVNVVMADDAQSHASLLFTRGDTVKSLPGGQ
jgi:hypothetical protein